MSQPTSETCDKTNSEQADIPILTAAIAANADILLTGDKDFSDIPLDKPLIMNPGTFMKLYMKT
jgi:predicted nucleic acid-binding protein